MNSMTLSEVEAVVAAAHAQGERADLRNANLTRADLASADLGGASLADDPVTVIEHGIPEVRAWAAQRVTDPTAFM